LVRRHDGSGDFADGVHVDAHRTAGLRRPDSMVLRLLWVCAVKRRRFPAGASPARQPLQPEATGADMEVTKCLKPSGRRATNWWQRECAGRNASERRASLEKDDAQADPATLPGKADITGRMSKAVPPVAVPG
jgi:hypothetical protein